MALFLYNFLIVLFLPLLFIFGLWRVFISGKSRESWKEQMGFVNVPDAIKEKRPVWVHAVSVGESVACAPVVAELKRLMPERPIVVSTTTQTGQKMARETVKDADFFFYYPVDLLPFVWLSIMRVNPVLFASTDTEIWPNFLYACNRLGVKTAIINGTISDSTFSRAMRVRWFFAWAFSHVNKFFMQTERDAKRAVALGASEENTFISGNCKADQAILSISEAERDALKSELKIKNGRQVFVAGSTNPGEDMPCIEAFVEDRKDCEGLLMVLAPRQLERAVEIQDMIRTQGLKCARRSVSGSIAGDEDVIILDTFGELAKVYALADVTFVGGTLIPKGGHSLMQPVACGKPVIFGPHIFKTADVAEMSKRHNVGYEVADAGELSSVITRFLSDCVLREEAEKNCALMMDECLGASVRTAALVSLMVDNASSEPAS